MDFRSELSSLIAAQAPLIHLVTYEEERALQLLTELGKKAKLGVTSWDIADGFETHAAGEKPLPAKDCTTETILPYLAANLPSDHVVVLKDFHHSWAAKRAFITRKLRNLVPKLRTRRQMLVFLTPPLDEKYLLPSELRDDVVVLDVPLPNQAELDTLFGDFTSRIERARLPRPEVRDKLVSSVLGLTTTQARWAFARVWAQYRAFDERGIELATRAKQRVIRESGALEFWPAEAGEGDVGGLDLLKKYVKGREQCFTADKRDKLSWLPRGVLLAGIPGTGKSLSAKMIAGLWKWPLLRLDLGAVFGSLLGESEKNLRLALNLADTVSPCVLWIDEVEKAFAGASPLSINAGGPTRVLGTFLTWAQEHRTPVYVVGTANLLEGLPPEFIGRFDRLFFVDLPNERERAEIFRIHLKRARVLFPDRQFRMSELVERSRGFVGREIERAVREAEIAALTDGEREMTQADLLVRLEETRPISRSHAEVIEELRKWKTEGRAFPASTEETRPAATGREIEVPR